mmetsp:Transcript_23993/g.36854  ORF Transcript_23993/g.36854 Transcript_23993/m.36854 type:complete len:121 (+) Transcript_23993:606-968(+)|eukprot:CAMPEP_0170483950 /NCGR_PEP_ID=MMETSP0208-20121228/3514_1 /TAXON_ID=197538 /ORGANISM="Strombidium inclinatum, Strain S3" /LENGTH=120 /DNA_ID=CAMNT_0010757151 /DNA_START=600 /DNA_END=962 /DNA_ORIENTATION=-
MNVTYPDLDAVLINGDFVAHGIPVEDPSAPNKNATWDIMKKVITQGMDIVRNRSQADIFPSLGNNDVVVHYQVPCQLENKETYYSELFDVWFPEGKQPKDFNSTDARTSFLDGGYYKHRF